MNWISVKDRLPKLKAGHQFSDHVLVWPRDPLELRSFFGWYSGARQRIETSHGHMHEDEFSTGPITHWMPVPEGPKAKHLIQTAEDEVLEFLREHGSYGFSSNDVFRGLISRNIPYRLVEVRAALSYLLDTGKIQFNDELMYQIK